jgi:hypothetical protein
VYTELPSSARISEKPAESAARMMLILGRSSHLRPFLCFVHRQASSPSARYTQLVPAARLGI